VTGEPLSKRSDDNVQVFAERLRLYNEATAPLLAYFKDMGHLQVFSGVTSNELFPKIKSALEPLF
jgi:adenylate kinase family enzyme